MQKHFKDTMTITIFRSADNDGFFYDIYDCEASEVDDSDSVDGGFCTSDSIEDAYMMATSQANRLMELDLLVRDEE